MVWLFSLSGHGFKLEEVSTGTGKVIPSSKEQVIQSLEGGILTKLNVQEGDIVQKGKFLLSSTQPVLLQMWASRDLY